VTDGADERRDSGTRHPRWVYVGEEPDPRFSLANERTFLAWVRTTLALVAGAVALESLQLPERDLLRTVVVLVLLVFALVMTVLAFLRWARIERAMRLHQPLPAFTLGLILTAGIVGAVIGLAVVLVG
jgi:putative membrane protein